MASGTFLSGRKIDPVPKLFVGAVENPGAPPFDYRADRAIRKVEAGARFMQLQICHLDDRLAAFMAACVDRELHDRCAILPNIYLVGDARALQFMNDNVPGTEVPEATIARVSGAPDPPAAAYELVVEQARLALSLPDMRGPRITSFREDDAVARLLGDLGVKPRTERESDNANGH